MASTPIQLNKVSAHFRGGVKGEVNAVHNVSLNVRSGELLTLLGPSGCGKTTTLRMIAGFQEPSAGTIMIGEQDVTYVEANERNIGFVFQNYALFPHLTVFENVAYGLRVKRQNAIDINSAVTDVLAMVGLARYEQQLPHQLSGGEQQRVALARAIVIKPRVLLFDEPLSNLDAKLRVQMRAEIRALQKRLDITTVYVTHDQEEAMAISDRIAVMKAGTIVQLGDAEELYRRPASAFVADFIGHANILDAVVDKANGGQMDLLISGQRFSVEATSNNFRPGVAVRAVIRPEAIAIAATGDGLKGTVTERTYLGDKVEYTVDIGGTQLRIAKSNPQPHEQLRAGDSAVINIPAGYVQLLSGEE